MGFIKKFPNAEFLDNLSGISRNNSLLYSVEKNKVVLKKFEKPILFKRELFIYDLFNEIPIVKTPKIFYEGNLELATYFINSEKEKDILLATKDWAKIHSYFINNNQIEKNKILMKHDIIKNANYLLVNINSFGKNNKTLSKILNSINSSKTKTLICGDLFAKNFLTLKKTNYYFDFEFSGIGSPAKDVASLILHHPTRKEKIIELYKDSLDFKYPSLEKEIKEELIVRGLQLIYLLDKKDMKNDLRQNMKNKFWEVIEDYM